MIWEIRYELIGYLDLATRRSLTVANAKKVSFCKSGQGWGLRRVQAVGGVKAMSSTQTWLPFVCVQWQSQLKSQLFDWTFSSPLKPINICVQTQPVLKE